MSNNIAIQVLLKRRKELQEERIKFLEISGNQIREIDHSIAALNGGEFILSDDPKYDDESPDYIKGTEDGI